MTHTTPKIIFRHPLVRALNDGETPDESEYSENSFVQSFKRLAGTGQNFGIEVSDEIKSNRIPKRTLTLKSEGSQSADQVREVIREKAPEVFSALTKYTYEKPVSGTLSLSNIYQAFEETCAQIVLAKPAKFENIEKVKQAFLDHFSVELNMNKSTMNFNGTLFAKIALVHNPRLEEMRKEGNVKQRGESLAQILNLIQRSDRDIMKSATEPRTSLNGKAMEPLVLPSQWNSVVAQAKKAYIAYTPADGDKEADYRFYTIADDQSEPGRKGKVEGSKTLSYIPYRRISNALYDRTVSKDGKPIQKTESKSSVQVSVDGNGFSSKISRLPAPVSFSKEEKDRAERARKHMKEKIGPNANPTKSISRLLEYARENNVM